MSFETDAIMQIMGTLKTISSDAAETKETTKLILAAVETGNQTLLEILAACQGDGSGELVAQLRKLTEAIQDVVVRMDTLPMAVAEQVSG